MDILTLISGLSLRVSFTSKNQSRLKDLKSLSGGQKAAVSLVFILAIQVVLANYDLSGRCESNKLQVHSLSIVRLLLSKHTER